jgi:Mn2+/Fe2+ NRAMP family transporter
MLLLVNKRDLMGKFTNSRGYNYLAWAATVLIIALTVVMLFTSWS